jgi:hypothetical protein
MKSLQQMRERENEQGRKLKRKKINEKNKKLYIICIYYCGACEANGEALTRWRTKNN